MLEREYFEPYDDYRLEDQVENSQSSPSSLIDLLTEHIRFIDNFLLNHLLNDIFQCDDSNGSGFRIELGGIIVFHNDTQMVLFFKYEKIRLRR